MKKVSNKEFWEVLEKIGLDTNESILNMLSLGYRLYAKEEEQDGFKVGADIDRHNGDYLYDFLKEHGYYNI